VSCGSNINWIFGNIVVDRDRFNQDRKFGLSIASGRIVFGVSGNGTGDETICGTTSVLDGQWHHVAVQRRRADGRLWLFVDGAPQAEADGPDGDVSYPDAGVPGSFCGGPCTNSDPFLVIAAEKHDAGPAYPSYAGWLDEVRLSTVLRYAGPFTRPSQPFASDVATAALYHFDEGTGNVVGDASGAAGGPSHGVRRFGGAPAGPEWSTDTPFTGAPAGARVAVDAPTAGAAVSVPFVVGGWALDLAAPAGAGVDAVHVYAFPAGGGAPVFLGVAGIGGARPDLAAAFGPQFATAGFSLVVSSLAPGSYQLGVFARSTVTGAFQPVQVPVTVTVSSRVAIDTPGPGAGVTQPFLVGGWALDLAAPTGTGVDAVHVYAFPAGGGAAVFLGVASVGGNRPDLAAIFGSQFAGAGFGLSVSGLAPGAYQLAVFAHSAVTGTFAAAQVAVTVAASSRLAVDTPGPGAGVTPPFLVGGWALDLAAPAGAGVDTVHVYAFPAGGGAPAFLGSAATGLPRPDVAAVFGPRFATPGFGLVVGALAPGSYQLVVYGRSIVTGAFDAVQAVPIVVR
jgi:hypothetical protein